MLRKFVCCAFTLFLFSCQHLKPHKQITSTGSLSGKWTLTISGLESETLATATIYFESEKDHSSCLSGSWKNISMQTVYVSEDMQNNMNDKWSYTVNDNELLIGRNSICDAYLSLSGDMNNRPITGDFIAFGAWGSKKFGSFTLEKLSTGQ